MARTLSAAVALLMALAVAAGCATVAREAAQLRNTKVACQLGNAAPAGAARAATLSAYDCASAGGSYEAGDALADFNLWLALAKEGDPVAQTRIGTLYEEGVAGIAPDHTTAVTWYRRAVKQVHAPAMLRLAVLTDQGLGVRGDADHARDLLRRASRGANVAIPPPRLYLVEPSVLLSGPADGPAVFSAVVDRPEGALAVMGRVSAAAERPRTVLVNEQVLKVDKEGYFRTSVTLRHEGTTLRLKTSDPRSEERRVGKECA